MHNFSTLPNFLSQDRSALYLYWQPDRPLPLVSSTRHANRLSTVRASTGAVGLLCLCFLHHEGGGGLSGAEDPFCFSELPICHPKLTSLISGAQNSSPGMPSAVYDYGLLVSELVHSGFAHMGL